jgi:hypothetical protein
VIELTSDKAFERRHVFVCAEAIDFDELSPRHVAELERASTTTTTQCWFCERCSQVVPDEEIGLVQHRAASLNRISSWRLGMVVMAAALVGALTALAIEGQLHALPPGSLGHAIVVVLFGVPAGLLLCSLGALFLGLVVDGILKESGVYRVRRPLPDEPAEGAP